MEQPTGLSGFLEKCRLEGAKERDQILLFLGRKLRAEDEVEELDRVLGTKLVRRNIK
jgi:hypothetical protein